MPKKVFLFKWGPSMFWSVKNSCGDLRNGLVIIRVDSSSFSFTIPNAKLKTGARKLMFGMRCSSKETKGKETRDGSTYVCKVILIFIWWNNEMMADWQTTCFFVIIIATELSRGRVCQFVLDQYIVSHFSPSPALPSYLTQFNSIITFPNPLPIEPLRMDGWLEVGHWTLGIGD